MSSFTLKDKEKTWQCSTLDHCENKDANRGKQTNGINCGNWVLMEMFHRKKGYMRDIGSHTRE